ncbi:hypothetical protein EV130_105385 [Rhizobium azibense]|uniref:Uncharacterized protein n=1 Tax=Rhizobium azibense TaxID=1136135 RepID=A0A4R3QWH3_9HYPH|nr:hypothetical protein [Rhizobium azibense]TCU25727.1 hypothetical protein EV130_105385 [Rhizobium azibense]
MSVADGKGHYSNGPVFSVAPMIDWTDGANLLVIQQLFDAVAVYQIPN